MTYRADIDGLRAVAVLSVLFFHFGFAWLPGGFIGVDVFFVISGYLITRNLTERIESKGLSLVDFYDRRIRRIMPALLLVLLASLAAGYLLLMPGDYAELGKSAAYSAFGAGNFYFFWNTGYFDREAELQPLLHMWSLGVEEQFYLAWPMLLALFLWLGKRHRAITVGLILAVITISLAVCVNVVAVDPKAAFYLPHTRAWELAVGALLVFLPDIRSRPLSEAMGPIGLGLIAYSFFTLADTDPFPGWSAVPPVLGSALLLWPREHSWAARILAVRPMRFIGLISYSLYLWHWPVIVFFRHWANGDMPTAKEAVALAALSVLLAWLSWRYVERPFRRPIRPLFSIPGGLGTSTLTAVLGVAIFVSGGIHSRISSQAEAMSSLDVMWQWDCSRMQQVGGLDQPYCNFGKPWDSAATKAIVWGDSHAEHMAPIIEEAARNEDASFLLYRECPAALGGHVRRVWNEIPTYVERCADMRNRAIQTLSTHPEINLIVLSASWSSLGNVVSQDGTIPGDPSPYEIIGHGVRSLIEATAQPGRRFLIIADVPQLHSDPIFCAMQNYISVFRRSCSQSDESVASSEFRSSQGGMYDVIREIASEREDTDAVFPGDHLCTEEWCQSYMNGEFLYRDASHIRRNLSEDTKRLYGEKIGLSDALLQSIRGSKGAARRSQESHQSQM